MSPRVHEVTLSNAPPYQAGPFGNYYLSTLTPLFQAGSRTAAEAGLTNYTTFVNQTKDAADQLVNIGLHYVAAQPSTLNPQPLDSDGDGIPDYVEGEHGTDPNNPMTDGVTNDVYNAAYDNVDLSGDGLTGQAKRLLGMDPLAPDNPLNLPGTSLPSLSSGLVIIPLLVSSNLDDDTPLTLYADGREANAKVYQTNGNWFAQWDTTAIANGPHSLSLEISCLSEGASDCFGGSSFVTVNNPLTFTTLNSTFCDLLVIDATVNNGASSYSIDVYDSATSAWLTNLSGTVSDGKIETSWDLTDGNGNIISTGPVTCEFSLFNGSSLNASNSARANDSGSTSATKMYPKFLRNPYNATFAVAWGDADLVGEAADLFSWGICGVVDILNQYWEDPKDPALVYWILPYGASGNANDPGGDISFNFGADYPNSKTQLLGALMDSGNFFWAGHGSPTSIGTTWSLTGSAPKLKASEIASTLGNPTTAPNGSSVIFRPYKLVILRACSAYSKNFADAFGIADYTPPRTVIHTPIQLPGFWYLDQGRSTNTVDDYVKLKKSRRHLWLGLASFTVPAIRFSAASPTRL